jgi:hypothetical protein
MRRERRRGGATSAALLGVLSFGARAAAQQGAAQEFVGPATCDATSCHGAAHAQRGRIAQDEYATWDVLASPLGRHIGERLQLDPTRAPDCLACHAAPIEGANLAALPGAGLDAGATRRASLVEFGVSCEACHGPASSWYGSHFQEGFDRAGAVARGALRDLRDPVELASICAGCHVGDAARGVSHDLLAAGHPELGFELGTYLLEMPPHWRQRGEGSREWLLRAALVGQAVALREQMALLAREAQRDAWPEYARFECISCHHDLDAAGWDALRDWRLERGRPTPLGRPLFEGGRVISTCAAVGAAAPELAITLEAALEQVERDLARPNVPRETIRAAAEEAAALCDRAAKTLRAARDPESQARAAVAALARDAELIAAQGIHGAEQAARFLYALELDLAADAWLPRADSSAAAIESELLAPLAGAERYDPGEFARRFAELALGHPSQK